MKLIGEFSCHLQSEMHLCSISLVDLTIKIVQFRK